MTTATPSYSIRPLKADDQPWVDAFLREHWGDTIIVVHGTIYHPAELPGFVAEAEGRPVGLLTYALVDGTCEIVTLDSLLPRQGIATALITATIRLAREAGCRRLWLITTNDNLQALRFYQKRGLRLVAVHVGAVDVARQIKPAIPVIGDDGIPLHDELELALEL